MLEQKQLFRHRPEEGLFGDCYRTAVACILNLAPERVPHVYDAVDAPGVERMKAWLACQGLALATTLFSSSLSDVLAAMQHLNPGLYYLLTGTSRNGTGHVVVCCGGKIVWDPSLDDSGIVGPCEDGYYWIEVVTPLTMVAK